MNSKERMLRTLDFTGPDKLPLVYHPSEAGLHVHGEKLLRLFQEFPGDSPQSFSRTVHPAPETIDANGNYHEFKTDAWGTVWEYLIFGIQGHPKHFTCANWQEVLAKPFPPRGEIGCWGACPITPEIRRDYMPMGGGGGIFEPLQSLRPMEEFLMDLACEDEDLLTFLERWSQELLTNCLRAQQAGIELFTFGDDYGTQQNTLIAPEMFRRVFLPHYQKIFAALKAGGGRVLFHSCGEITPLLDDFIDMGSDCLWLQFSLYGQDKAFLQHCLDRRVTLLLHPDRQRLIPLGTPAEIERWVADCAERYHQAGGGGIFYVEIENDAPWCNVETLIRSIDKYR